MLCPPKFGSYYAMFNRRWLPSSQSRQHIKLWEVSSSFACCARASWPHKSMASSKVSIPHVQKKHSPQPANEIFSNSTSECYGAATTDLDCQGDAELGQWHPSGQEGRLHGKAKRVHHEQPKPLARLLCWSKRILLPSPSESCLTLLSTHKAHADDGPHSRHSVPDHVKTNSLIQLHKFISVNYDKLSAVIQQEDEGLAEELQQVMDSIGNIDAEEL